MKTAVIRSSWMPSYGCRLDCMPYLGGALETKVLLEQLPLRKDKLHTLTTGFDGGIYNGPQFVRNYVESPEQGVPFITGSSLQLADISNLPLLSRRDAHGPRLRHLEIRPGMSLISCSGTIGKMAYARSDMAGVWSSQDVLKVVADPARILSGYLYAYLCSRFGVPLVASGTYGAIIQHLEPEHIADLPVPRLGDALEHEIHSLVEEASELRTKASSELSKAKDALLQSLGSPPKFGLSRAGTLTSIVTSDDISQKRRSDPWFFNGRAVALQRWVESHKNGFWRLGDIADVFGVSPFKRVYVADSAQGVGFFGSADIFKLDRTPETFIARAATKAIKSYVLPRGAVLLASSGQLNGIIGRPQFVDSALAGQAASNHVLRIVPRPGEVPAGYLFVYLALEEIGHPLIQRTATGDSIPEIWPTYLNEIPVLKAPEKLMEALHTQVIEAFEMRVRATKVESKARERLEEALEENVA